MYADEDEWEKDFKEAGEMAEAFAEYSGRLGEGAEVLLSALQDRDALWMKAEKVYVYSQMKKDEDNRSSRYQELNQRAQSLLAEISARTSFFTPQLTELPEGTIEKYMAENSGLEMYSYMLLDLIRRKQHILSGESEEAPGADERDRRSSEADFRHDQQRGHQIRKDPG